MIIGTTITGLKTTIYADDGFDEVLVQTAAVSADCEFIGGQLVRVTAPDGITFSGNGTTITRPDGFDITGLCDLAAVARQVEAKKVERAELRAEAAWTDFQLQRMFAI